MKKKERFKIYELMSSELKISFKKFNFCGFCHVCSIFNIKIEECTELMKFKPKKIRADGYWFNPYTEEGLNKRLKILRKILKEEKI